VETTDYSFLKKIKLSTGKKINTLFAGEYHSAFKGFGLSFDSVREYQFGDDIRHIDWNVSARMNHMFIKQYIEERELSVVLMIDVSGSNDFGSVRVKRDLILEIVTIFLFLTQLNNDSVSVLLFSDKVEKFVKPQKGRKFILKVLDEIVKCNPSSKKTSIGNAIDFTRRVLKKRSVIFLISDFIDKEEDYLFKMKLLNKKHDLIPIQIIDPMEQNMKFFGLTEFVDLESGKTFLSDSLPEQGKGATLKGFDIIKILTSESPDKPILKFFERRNRSGKSARS